MRMFRVVVVAVAVQVGGHHRYEIAAVLVMVSFTQLDARNLGDGVGLIRGLQQPGEQILLLDGLRGEFAVDAARPQKKQFSHPTYIRSVDAAALDRQVCAAEIYTRG